MNLVYNQTMIRLNVQEAKTHLSRYLDQVAQGETVVLCRRNVPIAEIRRLPPRRSRPRPFGLAKGLIAVPDSFFEPMPPAELQQWQGL
ncbi:MAG: type II toxin-antitoxin system Phd/YefM family antitoxin [Terriglobales bacterium]